MTALIASLLSSFWPYIVAAAGALLVFWRMMAGAKKAGVNQQKVEEAKARERDLQNIKAAQAAGARVQPDDPGVLTDRWNRDSRRP